MNIAFDHWHLHTMEYTSIYYLNTLLKELIYFIDYSFSSRAILKYGSDRQQTIYIDNLHNP